MSNDGAISIVGNQNTVVTDGNNSLIVAGNGSDTLTAGANSIAIAGNGSDTITVGADSAIVVGNGNDTLAAGANSLITAGNGNDTIYLGANDLVAVGNGKNTFVIPSSGQVTLSAPTSLSVSEDGSIALAIGAGTSGFGFGDEAIFGFTSNDKIQIGTSQFANFAALMAAAKQVGDDTVITADAADIIVLDDVRLSSLTASNFSFVNGANVSVKISGIPAGVTLSDSAGAITVTNGSATLTQAQLAGLTLKAAGVTSATLTLTATDSSTGTSISKTIALSVNPVAPTLTAPAALTVNAGGTVALGITETPFDSRDVVSLTIKGVPSDATLSAGIKNVDGSWTLTPAQLSGLSLKAGSTAVATLMVTATNTLGQTASTEKDIHLTVVTPLTITFDTVSFTDTGVQGDHIANNGSVTLSGTVTDNLTVSQVQIFNNGSLLGTASVDNVHHTWTLTQTLAQGNYNQLSVKATDTAGNTATVSTTQSVLIDTTPPAAVAAVTSLSADTGSSASDFITDVAAQTVSGTYTGTLASGEKFQVSTNGTTWIDATAASGTWSASGVTLGNGAGTLQVRTIDPAGNVTAGTGHGYTLDTTAPTAVATVTALSADTGGSASDFITDVAAQTVSGTYTGTLASGEKFQISTNGSTWIDATAASGTWSASGVTLANGAGTLQVRTVDTAGNVTAGTGHGYTLDTTAPTAFATVTALSADTGSSASDFITDVAAQTVSGTYTGTLASGEKFQISTNGSTWIDASAAAGTWSASGVTLANGTGTLQVRTIDTAGNVTTGTGHGYTLDTTAPTAVATVTALSADTGSSASDFITDAAAQTVSGTYTGTLASGEKVQISTNGSTWIDALAAAGTWSASGVTLANGAGTIQVRTIDTAGNVTAGTGHGYTLDTTAPTAVATVTALSADTGGSASDFITDVAAQTVSGTYTGTLASGEKFQVSTDGASWIDASVSAGTWSASGVALPSGAGTIQVRTVDTAGNIAAGTGHGYTLDTVAPTAVASVTALSVDTGSSASDFITDVAAQTVSGTYTGTLASGEKFQVSTDGASWIDASVSAGTWSASGVTLANGIGTIQVRTIDTAGNLTAGAGHNYTLDTTAPTASISAVSTGPTSATSDLITVHAADANGVAAVAIDDNGNFLANATQTSPGVWSYAANGLSSGAHDFTAVVTDTAGNLATTNHVSLLVDTTAPAVTFDTVTYDQTGAAGFTKDQAVTLSGTTSDNVTVSQVEVFSGTQSLGHAIVDNVNHSWSLTENLGPGVYTNLSATATDEVGNSATASNSDTTQTLQVDTTAPTVTLDQVSFTDTGTSNDAITDNSLVTLSGSVADDVSVAQVQVLNGTQILGNAIVDSATHTWSLQTNLADGTYANLSATATDEAGNTTNASNTSAHQSLQIDTAPPAVTFTAVMVTHPADSSGTVSNDGQVTFSGSVADAAAISQVQVYNGAQFLGAATVSNGTWTLATTLADASYNQLHATAADIAGNSADASTQHIVTVAPKVGQAIDGYISGATVFADGNNDGVLDNGEASGITDASGHFTLGPGTTTGNLVLTGGTDTSTGLAFTGVLTATAGSTQVTPLTTLVEAVAAANGGDVAAASQSVATVLGLDPTVDLSTTDPLAAAYAGDTQTFVAASKVLNTVSMVASAVSGTGAASFSDAASSAFSALATQIVSNGSLDLNDSSVVTNVVGDTLAAVSSSSSLSSAQTADIATIVTNVNAATDQAVTDSSGSSTATLLTNVSATSIVAQGSTSSALQQATSGTGDLSTVVANNSGTALSDNVTASVSQVGNVLPAPPAFVSLTPTDASPNNLNLVHYTLTFSDPVTGVTASDFTLATTGLTGSSIAGITPVAGSNGTQYTIAVNAGTGDGTLALNFTGATVLDLAGNPLADPATHTGPAYIIDQDTAEQAALFLHVNNTQVNSAGSAIFSFTVGGLESDDSGTVTFTDGVNQVSVNVTGGQANYTANLGTLSDGPITSSLALNNDAAGNSFLPVGGTSIISLGGFNVVNGVRSNGGTLQAVQNGSGDITLVPTGSVVATAGNGVIAEQNTTGIGNIVVNSSASLTGTGAGTAGLLAENLDAANGGNVTITETGAVSGGQYGIRAITQGSGNIAIEAGGAVTGGSLFGIRAEDYGTGNISVLTDAGSTINSGSSGINVLNFDTAIAGSANSTITVTTNGTIHSGTNVNPSGTQPQGIVAGYYGANATIDTNINGNVVINNNGNVTAAAGYGIDGYTYGNGNVTVNEGAGTSVSGVQYAIGAFQNSKGTGNIAVNVGANATLTATGTTAGSSFFAIQAFSNAVGNVSVTTGDGDTITAPSIAVNAQSQATSDPSTSSVSVILGNDTIHSGSLLSPSNSLPGAVSAGYSPNGSNTVSNSVAGNVSVQSNATILADKGAGINAYNWGTGNVTVTTGATSSITALTPITIGTSTTQANGINANALNGGNVSVTNGGSINAATGINASAVKTGSITIENDGQITAAGTSGINVTQNAGGSTGSTTITNTGTVVGAANHSSINVAENAIGTVTINNSGTIGSGTISSASPAITENGGAAVVINNSGQINGSIYTNNTGGFTGTFNNNAGASWQSGYIDDEGTITASGAGSTVALVGNSIGLAVGNSATGSLTIAADAALTASFLNIGNLAGSHGAVNVTGTGTSLNITSGQYPNIGVGFDGTASLTIANQAAVTTSNMDVAANHDAGVTDTLDVNHATLTTSQGLIIGDAGSATATVENGGTITTGFLSLASQASGVGSLTVTGAGSAVTTGGLNFGATGGSATLTISNGGAVAIGTGTTTIANAVHVGSTASLAGAGIINGNLVDDGSLVATGGLLEITGTLSGTGSVTIDNGATLELGGAGPESFTFAGGNGTLQLDNTQGFTGTIAGTASGSGNFTITGQGNVSSASGDAIDFTSSGGVAGNAANLILTTGGAISGALSAVNVIQNGSGDITVDSTGSIVGLAGSGVIAEQNITGIGDIDVNASGSLTGTGGGSDGLLAENLDAANSGNISVTALGGASGGAFGIEVLTQGDGNISLEAGGAVSAGTNYGIRVRSFGTGSENVTTDAGSVVTSAGTGINVVNVDTLLPASANSSITVTNNATINSGTASNLDGGVPGGIYAGYRGIAPPGVPVADSNVNGTVVVNNNGNITAAAGYGIDAYNWGNGNVTVNEGAGTAVSGAQYAIAAYGLGKGTGDIAVNVGANATLATTGTTNGNAFFAIQAFSNAVGNVSVTTADGDTITAASIAINAQSQATSDPSTSSVSVILGNDIIHSGSLNNPAGTAPVGAISVGYSPNGSNTVTNAVAGNVTVQSNATVVAATGAGINAYNYGTGNVTVSTGANSAITAPGNGIGAFANNGGNVSVTNGGSVSAATGINVTANHGGTVFVENDGQITAAINSGINVVQNSGGSTGSTTITNTGTVVGAAAHSAINVGENAIGTVTINNSGTIGSGTTAATTQAISESGGTVVVNNSGQIDGSIATVNTGAFTGNLNNNAGGSWQAGYITDEGSITASGAGSTITVLGTSTGIVVGNSGTGTFAAAAGATVTGDFLNIAQAAGSHGTVTVTGPGTTLNTTSGQYQNIGVGFDGTAALTIANQAAVTTTSMDVAVNHDVGVTDTLDVNNAALTSQGLTIGDAGTAMATVENGGTITTGFLSLASQASGVGSLTVTGAGSAVTTGGLNFGATGGSATLTVSNGGAVAIGAGTTTIANAVHVGSTASLAGAGIINGNLVDDGSLVATGGLLEITGTLSGTGSVTIDNGATLELGGAGPESITFAGGIGTLQLDNTPGFTGTIAGTASGAGNFAITGQGNVTSALDAIDFTASGGVAGNTGNLILTSAGAISGALNGVNLVQNGSGDITVDPTGSIVGHGGNGVIAEQNTTGIGNIVVNSSASLTGTGAGTAGLLAENLDAANGGNVTITETGAVSGGQYGIRAITQGSGNIVIEAGGAVTGGSLFGIRAEDYGTGNISVLTDAGSTINSGSSGINVLNFDTAIAGSANSTITVTTNGTIHSGTNPNPSGTAAQGIVAGYYGANAVINTNINGNVVINNNGNVTAAAGYGIQGYDWGNGNVTVNEGAGTSVSGVQYAIGAYQNSKGTGDIAVNVGANATLATTGTTNGNAFFAIQAFSNAVGNVSVTTADGDTITAASIAINAQSQATSDPSSSSVSVILGNDIIHSGSLNNPAGTAPVGAISVGYSPNGSNTVTNAVAGNVTVQSNATVVAATGAGINAYNYGTGNVTVSTGVNSSITAPGNGIGAFANNGGNVSVTNGGTVSAATGINVTANHGGTVFVENDGQITAAINSGINVVQNASGSTGSTTITNTGTVVGAAAHSAINVSENASGTVTINNSGTIGSATISSTSPAITENGGAAVVINNSGLINGAVYTTGVGTFTGTFHNNAGASWQSSYIDDEGTITASGAGSTIALVGTSIGLAVGNSAAGSLTIEADAALTASFLNIGNLAGSHGVVNVTGAGTSANFTSGQYESIGVGFDGTATLTISDHAVVTANSMDVAAHFDAGVTDALDINNATLISQSLTIGDAGMAHATVENGGAIDVSYLSIGNQVGSTGSLTVDGTGSIVSTASLMLGVLGSSASLAETHGGAVDIGTGTATIADAIHVGSSGTLQGTGLIMGNLVNDGNVTATGATLDVSGPVTGTGTFAIANGAGLEFGSSVSASDSIAFQGSTGTLKLDDPAHFSGQISGLSGTDGIDLAGFDAATTSVSPLSTSSSTILTVTDANHTVQNGTALTFTLLGDYTASTFTHSDDGKGGVLIVDPATAPANGATIAANGTNQTLTGTGSGDTFVFNFAAVGQDTITNFHADADVLQFQSSMFANAQAILDATHDDGHGNSLIALDAQDTITLSDVAKTQLHLTDFHVV